MPKLTTIAAVTQEEFVAVVRWQGFDARSARRCCNLTGGAGLNLGGTTSGQS